MSETTFKLNFPISYCKDGVWTFVEEFKGTYEEALNRAKELSEKDEDKEKQYRIWDNREK